MSNLDPGVVLLREEISSRRGLAAKIAAAEGISREAVWQWKRIPAERVATVSRLAGIPKHRLRPDVFPPRQSVSRT